MTDLGEEADMHQDEQPWSGTKIKGFRVCNNGRTAGLYLVVPAIEIVKINIRRKDRFAEKTHERRNFWELSLIKQRLFAVLWLAFVTVNSSQLTIPSAPRVYTRNSSTANVLPENNNLCTSNEVPEKETYCRTLHLFVSDNYDSISKRTVDCQI